MWHKLYLLFFCTGLVTLHSQQLKWASSVDFAWPLGVVDCGNGEVALYGKSSNTLSVIAKFGEQGQVIWKRTFPLQIQHLIIHNNDLYFCGAVSGSVQLGSTTIFSHGDFDAIVGKLNADGTLSWLRQFGGENTDEARQLTYYAYHASLMVTGRVEGNLLWQGGALESGVQKSAIIAEVSLNGNLAQHHLYDFVQNKNELNCGLEICSNSSGELHMLMHREGYHWVEQNPQGLEEGTYYMRIDKDFNLITAKFIISNSCYYGYGCEGMAAIEDEVMVPSYCSYKYGGEGYIRRMQGTSCFVNWSLTCRNSTYRAKTQQGKFYIAGTEGRVVCPCPGNLPGCEVLREIDGSDSGRVLLRASNCRFGNFEIAQSGTIYLFVYSDGTELAGGHVPAGAYLCAISNLVNGISLLHKDPSMSLYPNPSRDKLNISLKEFHGGSQTFILYDLTGIRVREFVLDAEQSAELDLSGLPPGTYILSTAGTRPRKVVIE